MPIKVEPSKICKCKRKEEPHVYLPEWCWEVIPPTKFIEQSGDKITGHYLSKIEGGRWRVHLFENCTLGWVIEQASHVIHEPTIHTLTQQRGN